MTGATERTFTLAASIDPSKIKATYDLGVPPSPFLQNTTSSLTPTE